MVRSAEEGRRFCLEVLQKALYQIGILWEWGDISAADEHMASSIVNAVIGAIHPRLAKAKASRGLAVVACSPSELHELGCRMVADFLLLEGWEVTYLGADMPKVDLLALLLRKRPFLVALSTASSFHLGRAQDLIEGIRGLPELGDLRIMAGGLGVNCVDQAWRQLGADGTARDGREAVLLANRWWAESPVNLQTPSSWPLPRFR